MRILRDGFATTFIGVEAAPAATSGRRRAVLLLQTWPLPYTQQKVVLVYFQVATQKQILVGFACLYHNSNYFICNLMHFQDQKGTVLITLYISEGHALINPDVGITSDDYI